jgi:predicted amidohydrolase YtcJ
MDSFDLLVVNGLVVTASDTAHYDIAVKNGKIVLLAPPGVLSKDKASRVIDAEGGYVMVQNIFQPRKLKLIQISISQVA